MHAIFSKAPFNPEGIKFLTLAGKMERGLTKPSAKNRVLKTPLYRVIVNLHSYFQVMVLGEVMQTSIITGGSKLLIASDIEATTCCTL